jgi:hypothetical protein
LASRAPPDEKLERESYHPEPDCQQRAGIRESGAERLKKLDEFFGGEAGLLENALERAAFEIFSVEWNRYNAWTIRMPEETMRTSAVIDEKPAAFSARITSVGVQTGRRGIISDVHRYPFDACRIRFNRDLLAMLHKTLQIAPDRVLYDRASFLDRVALGDEAR